MAVTGRRARNPCDERAEAENAPAGYGRQNFFTFILLAS